MSFNYESVKLIIAAGVCMKQVYDVNMKNWEKAESHISIARWFNVSKSRLYEVTTMHKIGRPGKGIPEELELDTPADTQIPTAQEAKCQADDLGGERKTKRQKSEKSFAKTKKVGKAKGTAQ